MNKKLLKKYKQGEKIEQQIKALEDRLQGVNDQTVELEKVELHKIYRAANLDFEDYKKIVEGVLTKDEARDKASGRLDKYETKGDKSNG